MRDNVKAFVKILSETLPFPEPVIEIGSLQVFGQVGYADLRPFFPGKKYIGCDMRPGPGVDRIERFETLTFADTTVGSLLALDTLEHVARLPTALEQAFRVLRPDGLFVISSHMFFPIHAEPNDYWRFTPEAFALLLERFPTRWVFFQGDTAGPHTVMAVASKAQLGESTKEAIIRRLDEIPECFPDLQLDLLYRYEALLASHWRALYPRPLKQWLRALRASWSQLASLRHFQRLPGAASRSLRLPGEQGYVDCPRDGAIVYGELAVWGWVLGLSARKIEIYLDDTVVAEATRQRPRPDLPSVFPHYPEAGSAGFHATVDLDAPPGVHRLSAIASLEDNSRVLIGDRLIYIPQNSTRRVTFYAG